MLYAANFDFHKLHVPDAWAVNSVLFAVILCAILVSFRRSAATRPLDVSQTTQIKGLAMLMVVLGHLWTHVAQENPWPVLAGESVAVFLMLSGFGLTVSQLRKRLGFRDFLWRRVRRMMLPYWVVTAGILLFDWWLLSRTLQPGQAVLTFLGINQSEALRHLDYVRWYVTFQLFWYGCFIAAFSGLSARRAAFLLAVLSVILFQVDYVAHPFRWSWYFAFPAGCLMGVYFERLRDVLSRSVIASTLAGVGLLTAFLFIKWLVPNLPRLGVPSILALNLRDGGALLYGAGAVALFAALGARGISSRFLLLCGTVSYELYLLHGPFLIKYNPFFGWITPGNASWMTPLSFLLLLACLLAASLALKKGMAHVFP